MKHYYKLKAGLTLSCFFLVVCCQSIVYGQISLTASGGTPTGSFATINDAFVAINAGTHTGSIVISVNGNTTEPATPVALAASGQGTTLYTDVLIKPTVVATIAGATTAGSAVINLDGADFVTIDGSIAVGGTTRDLTIQNTALNTVLNTAAIRLIGRTTLGLGATDNTIKNCNIIGSTPGNNGLSGSTVTTSYGIYAGSTAATTMSSATGGADYDNLTITNNVFSSAYIGTFVMGLVSPNQVDNLVVNENTFGTGVTGTRIGFKGFIGNHLVGGNFTNNTVFGLLATTSISLAGVEVGGSATSGFQIRRNTIYDIQSTSTGGWGAYGINITAGTGVVVSNNVIHGVQTVNYSLSTTFNAFGIRLVSGTGHQIYYNSVNMYGNYSTGSTTSATSAALVVTSTTVTGLDIRNNIFANSMTSTATTQEFNAVQFPASYNFATTNLERNAYMVTADAQHFVGKIGVTSGTGTYSGLVAWRAISQVGNTNNDVNSQPGSGNANAPFTSNTNLTIPAATVTVLESTGLPVASLGLPNVDRNSVSRPAGTGTNPDMGAYEFEGSQPADLAPPAISGVSITPGVSCTAVSHTVTATVTDNVGVASVTLNYSFGGVAQTPIAMTLTSGNATNGTYSGTIPAAAGPNVLVTYSIAAQDATPNFAAPVSGTPYTDQYLTVTASADQLITTGTATTVSATTNDPSFGRLLISEIIQFKTGTGDGTYPAYIPATDNDFVEIVNYGDVDANAGGYTITLSGGVNGTYTVPANTIIPSGGTLVLAFSGTASDPANRYFGMGFGTTSSGVAMGYVLRNAQGAIKDVVATNSYVFPGATGVTAADWSGNLASSSGLAGVRRTVATDNNNASDWTLSSAANLTNIGVYNSQITIVPIPQTITWTNNFNATTSTANPLPVAAFASPGVYTFYATFNDGTCTAMDSVVITVVTPVAPVAIFTATPLAGSAPLTVTFTDQSTNLPSTWNWTVSPSVGVTYISGTSSTSQNPIMTFANAGLYTITLLVSNSAGSDDSTIVQYINVNFCSSAATFTADTDIGNVTFGALNNGTATPVFSNPASNGLYTDFTALPPVSYGVGLTYPISVSQITSGVTFYNAHANVFIDYNNDGFFDPVTERVFNAPTSNVGPISTVSGSVTIPMTATLGNVRMRVILQEGGTSTSPPCGTYNYGETEDYIINLACTSTDPAPAQLTICLGDSAIFNALGNGVQWYADSVSTTVLSSGSIFNAGALSADTSFFVSSTDPGCVESGRTEFLLTVNQPSASSQVESVCGSYTWPVNGTTYTATGMYMDTLVNAAGCDSVITLDLTILSTSSSTDTRTECGSYTWSANGMTYTTTGMYTATLVNAAGCDSIVTLNLTVVNPNIGVSVSGATITATQGSAIYQWINCVGNTPIAGATSQSYTPTVNGSYAVIITIDGCTDTTACTTISNIGLGENELSNVMIAPNPTQNVVTITFEVPSAQLAIMDMNGKMLMSKGIVSGDQIDLSNFDYGVYFFTLQTGELTTVKRVVKQ